jgi:glutamate-1-semialdehyde 2,1-aminomutase
VRIAGGDGAAVLMGPAMCKQRAIAPAPGYLEGVRATCTQVGTILDFDEVSTGFVLHRVGVQALDGVTPDCRSLPRRWRTAFRWWPC